MKIIFVILVCMTQIKDDYNYNNGGKYTAAN